MITSAPTKLIICGEHYVVYGAPAITIPTKPRNKAKLEVKNGEVGINIINKWGNGKINKNWELEGPKYLNATLSTLKKVYELCNEKLNQSLELTLIHSGAPKGMGNSASCFAAYSLAFFKYLSKEPSIEQLFECVQAGETIAHGGRPSGIDAMTICRGKPQFFKKKFDPVSFEFKDVDLKLPKNAVLVIVNSSDGKIETTGELVKRFAKNKGISKKPDEMTENELKLVYEEYIDIYQDIVSNLSENGDIKTLGDAFNKNHELLKKNGVSGESIEKVRKIAIENGAYGAKLTGAGGEGGAVICLADENNKKLILNKIIENGYSCSEVKIDCKGPIVDSL